MPKPITKSRIKVEPDKKKRNFDLLKDGIKENPLYTKPYNTKKVEASNIIKENCEIVKKIVPGQLIYFNYFEPKTKEDLKYYDATPLTIYFSAFTSKEGHKMVLGFNIHYYPPKIRYRIMSLIYKLFRPMFNSTWEDGVRRERTEFNYDFIMKNLKKYNLDFGVRMYDVGLMHQTYLVPTKWFSTACFTEGNFKKETRAQIYAYWRNWEPKQKRKAAADTDPKPETGGGK